MLSEGPIPPDAILQCFHRALYHQMPPDAFTGPDTTRCQTAMLSQVPIPPDATRCNPIPPDARLQCFHRARYHQMTDCNAFTGPDTTRCQTAMLSQGPIPPDARLQCFHRSPYHQMPPDARRQCFHRARYHQMPDCNAFTGPDTTRCQTAMLSQVPIPPDATRCFHRARYHQMPPMLSQGPIPPDARLQCFHRAPYHQMPDCNAFTGPDTTRCNAFTGPDTTRYHTAMLSQGPIPPGDQMLSQGPIPPDARLQCFQRAQYHQMCPRYHQMPPDVTQYHQIPDCNAFTGPDTTRCQTAMLSQIPIPPDATRSNPIPPDARLQCFHRTRYHQMPDCNAFTGPDTTRYQCFHRHTTRYQTAMLSQGPMPSDATRCFHRARYDQMLDLAAKIQKVRGILLKVESTLAETYIFV